MNKIITVVYICFFSVVSMFSVVHASSIEVRKAVTNSCDFTETVELNVRFDLIVEKAILADDEVKKIKSDIEKIAKNSGIELITLKSMNFNLNSQRRNQGNWYQFNGNIRYTINDYQQSLAFVDELKQSDYQVSLSMNAYQNCR